MSGINGISSEEVKTRMKQINQETPAFWTTSLIKEPQELTIQAVTRNNIMMDKLMANQTQIISNQEKIMEKLEIGKKLDIEG